MRLLFDRLDSPLGTLVVVAAEGALRALEFGDHPERLHRLLKAHYGVYSLAPSADPGGFSDHVRRYFDGEADALDFLPVSTGGTPFQRQVWAALRTIPAGSTLSYAGLASRIGRPGASRAVGAANGANPLGIVVPCHRVIAADGTLGGYGGGIERKRWLLRHEGVEIREENRRRTDVAVGRPTCQSGSSSPPDLARLPAPEPPPR